MGGCASKDKKEKTAENGGGAAGGAADGIDAEGCVSNSMVFLAR